MLSQTFELSFGATFLATEGNLQEKMKYLEYTDETSARSNIRSNLTPRFRFDIESNK